MRGARAFSASARENQAAVAVHMPSMSASSTPWSVMTRKPTSLSARSTSFGSARSSEMMGTAESVGVALVVMGVAER